MRTSREKWEDFFFGNERDLVQQLSDWRGWVFCIFYPNFDIIISMKIVSGTYGGRPLKTLEGKTTRPTSDKVRGAMFNMIGPYFDGGRVLDLYAGSGGLSIEAVSRGMEQAVLVEKDRRAKGLLPAISKWPRKVTSFNCWRWRLTKLSVNCRGPLTLSS